MLILAQSLAHQTLRLVLARALEERAQLRDEGVAVQAVGSLAVGQQALRLGDQRILGANGGLEFGGAVSHGLLLPAPGLPGSHKLGDGHWKFSPGPPYIGSTRCAGPEKPSAAPRTANGRVAPPAARPTAEGPSRRLMAP
jgi:hypothetical protein